MNKYDRIRFQKLMLKLDKLSRILEEGDYWLDLPEEDQKEIEIVDWWGAEDMPYDDSDEKDDRLEIIYICRNCGRTIEFRCVNC